MLVYFYFSHTNYPCCNATCHIASSNKICLSSVDDFDCKKEVKCEYPLHN